MCIYVPEDISWKSSTERTFLQSSEGEVSSMCALGLFERVVGFFCCLSWGVGGGGFLHSIFLDVGWLKCKSHIMTLDNLQCKTINQGGNDERAAFFCGFKS